MKYSLKTKVSILSAAVIILISSTATYLFISAHSRSTEKEIIARGTALNASLSKAVAEGLATENIDLIKRAATLVEAENVIFVQVYSSLWEAVDAHPFNRLKELPDADAVKRFKDSDKPFHKKGDAGYDFYNPILYKPLEQAPAFHIGFVRLVLSSYAMEKKLRQLIIANISAAAAITFFAFIAINILISRLVVKPLTKLHKSVTMFKSGILPEQPTVYPNDEIGELTYEFNQMVETIQEDIAELKEAEKIISQSKQDWEETFDTITDMITVHDRDFNIVRANKAAQKILGLPFLEKTPDVKCFKYYHGAEKPPEECPSCQCFKTGKPVTFEIFEPHLKMFLEVNAYPRFDANNELAGVIHVVRDISGQKKMQEYLSHSQRLESIGTLAGGIAHDFNNILTAITGYGHILKMKAKEDDPSKAYIEQILASAERAANLTQSLLAFSRKQISSPEPVKLKGIIENVKRLLQRVIGENIELRTEISGEELTAMADSVQIEQVLVNLCTNARDAMPEGGVLAIKMKRVSADKIRHTIASEAGRISPEMLGDKGYAEISVIDTGTGMDEKTRERIFEPFFTTKEVGKGTGLGLSMVYGIVKQHHGHISVQSEAGQGTTFRIYLPLTEIAVSKEIKAAEATTAITGGAETILLAEDEETVRKLTKIVLEEFGYTVIEASDGQEAVSKFMENKDRIDLFLSDIVMPGMNGREAYERIKRVKPDIKVLFASGYPSDFTHKSEILKGGLDFISKPVSPDNLLKKVREVLDN